MKCSKFQSNIYEFVYGGLDQIQSREMIEHMKACTPCQEEYEELKKLLIDDMELVTEVSEEIKMPQELKNSIRKKILSGSRFNFRVWLQRYAAVFLLIAVLSYGAPVAAYYIAERTPLDKYLEIDSSAVKEFKEGRGQLVNKSFSMKDIEFTLDGFIREKDRCQLLYTVKVPQGKSINYAMPDMGFALVVEDQFGYRYEARGGAATLRSAGQDGEAKLIVDIEPLKFWSYHLKVRFTSVETGWMTVKEDPSSEQADEEGKIYNMKKDKNVYGCWEVGFYVSRSYK